MSGWGGGGNDADGTLRIYGRSGTAFPIVLPQGFRLADASDLRGGYLAAGAEDGDYPPFIDIYADGDAASQGPDLAALTMAIQGENKRREGASITNPLSISSINGRLVGQWEESYTETDDADAYSQLNAVVYVGDKRDHLYLAYYDPPESYARTAAKGALSSILASLPKG